MQGERGQALILVLILLLVGTLVIVPVLRQSDTNLRARIVYGQFIKDDYAVEAANDYALWKLKYDTGYAANLTFGVPSPAEYVTINGVTANSSVTVEGSSQTLSGFGLVKHQIKPTKTVTPTTALPGIPTTFTYTITMQRLEPDDGLFNPLERIIDGTDAGFVYLPNLSKLDGVQFDDDDLTILQEPVIVLPASTVGWSTYAEADAKVLNSPPTTANYGTDLTLAVASGLPDLSDSARSFLWFDPDGLPTGEDIVIQSALLTLWAYDYPGSVREYEAYRMTENWTETGIAWNNQPAVDAEPSDVIPTPSDNGTPMEWNVTIDLQATMDNTTANYGWLIRDANEGAATEVYDLTIEDTLEFDILAGKTPDIIESSSNVYAIAYAGDGDDGFLTTVKITGSGSIQDTVMDTFEFDTLKGKDPNIILISGNVFAIAYAGDGDDGFLKTVEIQNGAITDPVIDTLEFDTLKGNTPDIIPISGNVFAIAYAGDGDDGFLKTVEIADNGTITDTVIDTLEFDTQKGKTPDIIPVSGNVYAIAYAGDGDDGFLKTVEIADNGTITDTVIDTLEFDYNAGKTPSIIPVSGTIYAIVYAGMDDDGFLKTIQIKDDGQITGIALDTLEFDAIRGKSPSIIHSSGDIFAVAYTGDGDVGSLKMVEIDSVGSIHDILINTPTFDNVQGKAPSIIYLSGDIFAIAYQGDGDDGFVKSVTIESTSYVNHNTTFYSREDGASEKEPKLVVQYTTLGSGDYQTIEWIFAPHLDFSYGQERTLSFESAAILAADTRYWNAAMLQPNGSYTGMTANITVGNPPDTGIPGAGISVTKTADPAVVYATISTLVTYVISITNNDIGDFAKFDFIEDYLPLGFFYVGGSSTAAWPDKNSIDNPCYPYNIGDFEPDVSSMADGRLKLKWHNKESESGCLPGVGLLHDFPIQAGVTYTQTFQALAEVDVSGNYPNEVMSKLKDWNKYGDRGLSSGHGGGNLNEAYSWPTGDVMVPAYDILSETELAALRTNAAITQAGIEIKSWHWKKHK